MSRAVFGEVIQLELLPHYLNYIHLFRDTMDFIKAHMDNYKAILEDGHGSAELELEEYLTQKNYKLPSNINDVVLFALSKS